MERKEYHLIIINRIEAVRRHLGLNRSAFCREIGMKPQSYSNFVAGQATKPNIDLLWGIVHRWDVDARWLLDYARTGKGEAEAPVFLPGYQQGENRSGVLKTHTVPDGVLSGYLADVILRIPRDLIDAAKRMTLEFREPHETGADLKITVWTAEKKLDDLCPIHKDGHLYGSPACELAKEQERRNPETAPRDQPTAFETSHGSVGGVDED